MSNRFHCHGEGEVDPAQLHVPYAFVDSGAAKERSNPQPMKAADGLEPEGTLAGDVSA